MMRDAQTGLPADRPPRLLHACRNALRVTSVRIVVQTVTLGLLVSFVLLTTSSSLDRLPALRHWVGKLLEVDPLAALATTITTHRLYKALIWSLVILIPTLFLGRFFCNWICPLGTLNQFVGWLSSSARAGQRPSVEGPSASPNRYRRSQATKYYVLIALVAAALVGTLQTGLLDPICLIYRSLTAAVLPVAQMSAPNLLEDPRLHQGAWLIGFLLLALLAANLFYPRFFCRVLCPLGALLGLLSRLAWWRIQRDPTRCTGCGLCLAHCEGACDPHTRLRRAECLVCFNCIEDCPEGALRFGCLPSRQGERAGPDLSRRQLVLAGLAGLVFYPLARGSGRVTRDFSSRLIRPPGALEELEFLRRCIKCDQCIRVCPTNVIQPGWFEAGLEGLWTPVLNFRIGHCQLNCTACGQVCPTGAIRPITVAQKLGLGEMTEAGPIRLGTAHVDPGRCLPYSAGIACQVCEEVCPTSPKAIRVETLPGRQFPVPRVDLSLCIGCGLCERECPVAGDRRAIYVTADGETRSQRYSQADRNRSVRLPAPPRSIPKQDRLPE